MPVKPVFLTKEGRAKLELELKHLREEVRPQVAERIKAAKDFSDTTDDAEYEEAKNEQAFVEGRLLTIESMLANAVLIDEEHRSHDIVRLGSRVTVVTDEGENEHYTIVGSTEASPGKGRISNESPVGRALLGKIIGDKVQVVVPAGVVTLTLSAID